MQLVIGQNGEIKPIELPFGVVDRRFYEIGIFGVPVQGRERFFPEILRDDLAVLLRGKPEIRKDQDAGHMDVRRIQGLHLFDRL